MGKLASLLEDTRWFGTIHFIGILIHAGGNVDHTDGCILTGEEIPGQEKLKNQFEVTNKVKSMIKKALDAKEEVWITVNRK